MKVKILLLIIATALVFNSCSIFRKNNGKIVSNKNEKAEKIELDYNYSFFEASKQKMLGNYNEAISLYLNCLKLKPESGTPAYELANLAIMGKDLQSAIKFAEIAYKSDPKNKWFIITLADITKRQGNLTKTIDLLNKLVNLYPDFPDYYLEIASTYMAMKKSNEAIKTLDELEKKFGKNEELLIKKERIFSQKGDYINSRKELEKLISLNPQEVSYLGLLADSYLSTGQLDQAKEIYDNLLNIDPENGFAFLSLTEYYKAKKDSVNSALYLKKAFSSESLELNVKLNILQNNFVNPYTKKVDTLAFQLLDTVLTKNSNNPEIYDIYSEFLFLNNNTAEAESYTIKSLNLSKNNPKIWLRLFALEQNNNNIDSLYFHSKEAIELFPNIPEMYYYNSMAAYYLNRYSECISVAKSGLNYVIDDKSLKTDLFYFIAESYHRNKDNTNSDLYFDKVLELDPENYGVLNNYSYYLSLRNEKLDLALKMSEKLYVNNPKNSTYIDTYGWVLYSLRNYKKAEEVLEQAVKNGGNKNAVIIEHYGDALYKNNKIDKAVEIWITASKFAENNSTLLQKITEKKLFD